MVKNGNYEKTYFKNWGGGKFALFKSINVKNEAKYFLLMSFILFI